MSLRLKSHAHPDTLRNYGFKTGKEWSALSARGVRALDHSDFNRRRLVTKRATEW